MVACRFFASTLRLMAAILSMEITSLMVLDLWSTREPTALFGAAVSDSIFVGRGCTKAGIEVAAESHSR